MSRWHMKKETPEPLWATRASAWSPAQHKVLPDVQREPPEFQFVPIAPFFCPWAPLAQVSLVALRWTERSMVGWGELFGRALPFVVAVLQQSTENLA